jgi:S-DNA-T family DNA segregation ATPase FtsK/SpoIIIE
VIVRCIVRTASGDTFDVVLDVDGGATGADLMLALRQHGVDANAVSIDGRGVDPAKPIVEHPLTVGSVVDVSSGRRDWIPGDGLQLVVVSGPEAGAWYPLRPNSPLRVGRSDGEVRLSRDEVLSRLHVQFETDGRQVRVSDLGSRNGTLVEGVRLSGPLIVEPGAYVHAGSSTLTVVNVTPADRAVLGVAHDGTFAFPRSYRPANPELAAEVRLPRPPASNETPSSGWWRALIPLVSGVGMAILMNRLIFLAFAALAPIVYAGDAVWQKRKRSAKETTERQKYRDALAKARQSYVDAAAEDRRRRRYDHPMGGVASVFASVRQHRLWERRPSDDDFLDVTVGLATRPATVALVDPANEDSRSERLPLWGVPVGLDLAATGSATVLGPRDRGRAVVRSLLLGLAVTHAPTDVHVWLFAGADGERHWGGARWLPHTMADTSTCRIACTPQDRASMHSLLRQIIDGRREQSKSTYGATTPLPVHLVIFDGADVLGSSELSDLLVSGPSVGVYGLVIDETVAPDGTMGTLRLGRAADEARFESRTQPLLDRVLTAEMPAPWFEAAARRMAPLRPSFSGEAVLSSTSTRLADVVGSATTSPEHLATRWAASGPVSAVQVGTTSDAPFILDIVRNGPHGLVGGMSRSGKTEFLKTLLCSLAWANHPDDLSIVVVDFKGGVDYTMAADLPHVLDVSSNADLGLFERTVAMLSAEMERRQAAFKTVHVANLDAYRLARIERSDLPPIPRLLVLIDEFAELLGDDVGREQLRRIESMSRVGAGLGLHLLLITQSFDAKLPTQIAANAGLRICFRVQEPTDSAAVIDTTIAATIPASAQGRAYARLQGADPVEFQSARVAGRRADLQTAGRGVELRRQPFTTLRSSWQSGGPVDVPGPETDMFAMIASIRAAATAAGWRAPAIPWPGPLPADPAIAPVVERVERSGRTGADLVVGLTDHPLEQAQVPFSIGADGDHVAILGGPRADLSGILTLIACVAAASTSPDDLHIMAIDFTGRGLARVAGLPHCGAVASRNDALALRIARYVLDEVGVRRAALAREGVGSLAEYAQRTGQTFPHLLVVVAGAERLSTVANHDDVSAAAPVLTSAIVEGSGLGVQVIASGLPAFGSHRPGSYIDHRIVATAADVGDYLGMGCPRALLGELGPPRRAVDIPTRSVVQFCSLAGGEATESDVLDALVFRLGARWPREALSRPPRVIKEVSWPTPLSGVLDSLGAPPDRSRRPLPVALDEHRAEIAWIDGADVGRTLFVAGGRRKGKSNALLALGAMAQREGWHVVAVAGFDKSPLCDPSSPFEPVALEGAVAAVGAAPSGSPVLLLIDDIDRLDVSAVPDGLGDVTLCAASGSPAWMQGPQRALVELGLPRMRAGLLLAPESSADVTLLELPPDRCREIASTSRRAGQGVLADGTGDVYDVLVPLVDLPSTPPVPTLQRSAPHAQ